MKAYTMESALIMCGVNRDNIVLFDGNNAAQRIVNEVFDNDLTSCVNKSNSDLENDWKTYSQLTVAQGQIRLRPATKKNIRALVHGFVTKFEQVRTLLMLSLTLKLQGLSHFYVKLKRMSVGNQEPVIWPKRLN